MHILLFIFLNQLYKLGKRVIIFLIFSIFQVLPLDYVNEDAIYSTLENDSQSIFYLSSCIVTLNNDFTYYFFINSYCLFIFISQSY